MTSLAYLDNAIAFAQLRLRGGWKNLLVTTGAYGALLGGAMYVSASFAFDVPPSRIYSGWASGLLGIQTAVLLLFGTSRVSGAIRADVSSGMIESHRLMPLGAGPAVAGYLGGATCQAVAIGLATLLLGWIATAAAGLPVERWVAANVVLALFALFAWAAAAQLAFVSRGATAVLILPVLTMWMSQGAVAAVVPGLAVLVSPMAGRSIFARSASLADPRFAHLVGAVAQLSFGAICFVGAARRYRRADAQGITPSMGLLLLGAWVLFSSIGIREWREFEPRFARYPRVDTEGQLAGSIIATMLLALLPVSAAASADAAWRRRRAMRDPSLGRRRPLAPDLTIFIATLMTAALVNVQRPAVPVDDLVLPLFGTVVVVFAFLVSMSCLIRILYRGKGRGPFIGLFWILVTWIAPILAETVIRSAAGGSHEFDREFPGRLASCSPPVTIYRLWHSPASETLGIVGLGILIQVLLALVLAALYYRVPSADRISSRNAR